MEYIGKSIPRIEGPTKVTGQVEYVSDLEVPGMLYGKILRSPYPHARITRIDTAPVEDIPGLVGAVLLKESSGENSLLRKKLRLPVPLYDNKVRFVGDEVAAVAAIDPDIAAEAIDEIIVEYEELPAIFDPPEALRKGATLVHDEGNVAFHRKWGFGDFQNQMDRADVVLQDRFQSQRQAHVCMETKGCIASWGPTSNLTIISTTSGPHILRKDISSILDIPLSHVRVLNPPMGAAYGGRVAARMVDIASCLLARKTGRPVRIVNNQEEEFLSARTRYPYDIDIKVASDSEGRLLAWDVKVVGSNGAYNDMGPHIMGHSYRVLEECYNARSANFEGSLVYTNTQPGTAMRGFGEPQITFAIESMMDQLAHELGLEEAALRLLNVCKPRSRNYSGARISSNGVRECIQKAIDISGWNKKKRLEESALLTGYGMAVCESNGGGPRRNGYNSADAFLIMADDGSVTLITSAVDIGTGADTLMAQIVAEVLSIDISNVHIKGRDTDITTFDNGATGNRTSFVHGHAAKDAAEKMKKELLRVASLILDTESTDIQIKNGEFQRISSKKTCLLKEVVAYANSKLGQPLTSKGRFHDKVAPKLAAGIIHGEENPTHSFSCHVAKVKVDIETGKIDVLGYVAAHDCGTVLNMLTARGQVCGNTTAGFGLALMENLILDNGVVVNSNLMDYKIPSINDVPHINELFIETFEPVGVFGAKGLGDHAVSPVAAALANAIHDATGVRIHELPITPELLLRSIRTLKG